MLLSRLTYADPNAGSGYEMNAIASRGYRRNLFIRRKGKIGNTLVGAIILSTLTCGLQIMNVCHLLPDHCHRHCHYSRGVCG